MTTQLLIPAANVVSGTTRQSTPATRPVPLFSASLPVGSNGERIAAPRISASEAQYLVGIVGA
ncbi:MAG TPA: hypothetical protein VIY30_00240 [Burkholderiaceae bacterium]